jgi:hypothetical protein
MILYGKGDIRVIVDSGGAETCLKQMQQLK